MTELEMLAEKINELLANPKPNYKVGEITVDWGDYLKELMVSYRELTKISPFDIQESITIGRNI